MPPAMLLRDETIHYLDWANGYMWIHGKTYHIVYFKICKNCMYVIPHIFKMLL